MSVYTPDLWIVLKIQKENQLPYYRLFACWQGGYLTGDSWKINSGITEVIKQENDLLAFKGQSGSQYIVHPQAYGCSAFGGGIVDRMVKEGQKANIIVTIMDETTDWSEFNWK